MKKLLLAVLTVSILVFAFTSCSKEEAKKEEKTTVAKEKSEKATDAKTEEKKDESNEKSEEKADENKTAAIDFILKDKDGNDVKLSDYKGKIIFVNFFTTWCTYCKKELPDLEALSKEYGDDVQFLLVDVYTAEKGSVEDVFNWYEKFDFTMPMVVDENGTVSEIYPVQGFPTTYVIDKDFNVMGYLPGMITLEDGKNIIEGMLNK